jgi:hypothetical protein
MADNPALNPNNAAQRFIDSMTMTFDMWHDGTGYDIDALNAVPPEERLRLEALLLSRQPPDWRDIEALAQFDSPATRLAIEAALHSSDPHVRRTAESYSEQPIPSEEREAFLLKSLEDEGLYNGLSQALDEIAEFHTPRIIEVLLHGALRREGEAAVHFAAMLFFLYGKSEEPFDWNHRPFFLRFHATDPAERQAVFRELCEAIGSDPHPYLVEG